MGKRQKIEAFDIPEYVKGKRQRLRNNLALFGFTMLQRSVWVGEQKLPEKFIAQIHHRGLAKRGTLG